KVVRTENPPGEKIELHCDSDGEMEAWWVSESIDHEKNRFHYEDVAIFYRTNAQSRQLEDALLKRNIPYKIYGAVKFYDRLEVKDLMAYLRLVINPSDDVSLRRIINVPARGIGDKAMSDLEKIARENQTPLLSAIKLAVHTKIPKIGQKFASFDRLFSLF